MKRIIITLGLVGLLASCAGPGYETINWTPEMIAAQRRSIDAAAAYERAHPTPTPKVSGGHGYAAYSEHDELMDSLERLDSDIQDLNTNIENQNSE